MADPPTSLHSPFVRTAAAAFGILVLALLWSNSRILGVRRYQDTAGPTVLSAYYVYHGMAVALAEGRVGQLDIERYDGYVALNDPNAAYPSAEGRSSGRLVNYYSLDIGYSFVVALARLAFSTLPDNHLRALALQLFVDAAMVVFVFALFSQWHTALGWAASLLYIANRVFIHLVSFAFYYYWDIPLMFVALGMLLLASRKPETAGRWLAVAGAVLGLGVWIRASWWPISFLYLGVVLMVRPLRRRALAGVILFLVVATPQVLRSSLARGKPALSTRATWHVALVGLGYYPNPYGLEARDECVFALTREKYGVTLKMEDYGPEDEAARKEFLAILRDDPGFVVRSFLGRLSESIQGTTKASSREPLLLVPGRLYRALCLGGLLLMIRRGGDRRVVGLAAGATHVLYVVLTSLFYFVGLAYDNVSQVTLFILFIGLLDSGVQLALRRRRSASTS